MVFFLQSLYLAKSEAITELSKARSQVLAGGDDCPQRRYDVFSGDAKRENSARCIPIHYELEVLILFMISGTSIKWKVVMFPLL